MKEKLTLNKKEQNRVIVLNQVESKKLSIERAAILLKISQRQVWRLIASYRKQGAAGLAHGNRGRKPANAYPEELKEEIFQLATSKYIGFNHTFFREKLEENECISLSLSCVRSILLEKGLRSPRTRKSAKHRSRRERCPSEGMLLQTDGSEHAWLETRGPKLCLIGAIDDATNKVPYALFKEEETTEGYMRMMQEIVLNQGSPLALYHDRYGVFEVNKDQKFPSLQEQLTGREPKTQFGRLLEELGIESISAHSPQAKGRIERLWGTFQDRLTSELRLARARTIEEANQVLAYFLPDYNRKFAVKAKDPTLSYRKPGEGFKPEEYFCCKYERTVGADNVVRYNGKRLQILPSTDRLSYALCKVEVQDRFNGSLAIYYQGKTMDIMPAPQEATLMRKLCLHPGPAETTSNNRPVAGLYRKPAPNHPWRGKFRVFID